MENTMNFVNKIVIGQDAVLKEQGFLSKTLSTQVTLSYSTGTKIKFGQFLDNKPYAIIGNVFSILNEDPIQVLSNISSDEVFSKTPYFTGRWLLVTDEVCFSDASSLFNLYYKRFKNKRYLLSNFPYLIDEASGEQSERIVWNIEHGKGAIDWIPSPYSTRKSIYRLLPQRFFNLNTGEINVQPSKFEIELDLFEALCNATKNWSKNYEHCGVALTAGLDTRTLLAIGKYTESIKNSFTYDFGDLNKDDKELPPRLAEQVGISHVFCTPNRKVNFQSRKQIILDLADGEIINGRHPFIFGMEDEVFGKNSSILMGTVFEVGRCFYWDRFKKEKPKNSEEITTKFSGSYNENWHAALDLWITTLEQEYPFEIDWRDRFYLEQRMGAFGAGHHYYHELQNADRVDIANSLYVIKLLLSFSEKDRFSGVAQKQIIQKGEKTLLDIPFNPSSNTLIRKSYRYVKNIIKRNWGVPG